MGRVLGLVVVGFPLLLAINFAAQRVMPTFTSDPYGRRVVYRITALSLGAAAFFLIAMLSH